MAVEHDVYAPTSKTIIDPKTAKEKGEEAENSDYWEKKSRAARAKREFEDEERAARLAREREENPPEAPFQVKGSVNLGTFDFQQQQEELKDTIRKIQDDAKSRIDALEQTNSHYRDEVSKIQIQMVESTLRAQIESMQRALADGVNRKEPSFTEQLNQIQALAGTLGYSKKDEMDGAPEIRLQIMKMEMEDKDRQRKFEWDKMESERNWQLQLKKLEGDMAQHNAQIQAEKERRNMFVSPFESIGAAMARGLLDREATNQPSPHTTRTHTTRTHGKVYPVEAEVGETATLECPECSSPVSVGPTARSAVCANCDARFTIKRSAASEAE